MRTETTRNGHTVEVVEYGGFEWRRYPTHRGHATRLYFRRSTRKGSGPLRHVWLHQQVFIDSHGPIPDGLVVHHRDENTANNTPDNLVAITASDHSKIHVANIKKAIAAAPEWHASAEGREWHRAHGRKTWDGRAERTLRCEQCLKEFTTLDARKATRFCSLLCRHNARLASGADDIQIECVVCKKHFTANRYNKKKVCSKECQSRFISEHRKAYWAKRRVQHLDQ